MHHIIYLTPVTVRNFTLETALNGTSNKRILALINLDKGLEYPRAETPTLASIYAVFKSSNMGHPYISFTKSPISFKYTLTRFRVLSKGR
jgi:hypothetical protein